VLDELPRNALSKVDRKMLQAMAVNADKANRGQARAMPAPPNRLDERSVRRVAGSI
jgi:hypothetical protein